MTQGSNSDGISPLIFKAYDIRGVVGETLTEAVVWQIGQAIGSEIREAGLARAAIGRDGRLSGPAFAEALAEGLCSAGIDVVDIGMGPTPLLYYAALRHADGTGVMVTGSHNPPEYNGFKIMIGGNTLAGERIQRLHDRIVAGGLDGSARPGSRTSLSVAADYIKRIRGDVRLARPLRIVIDCGSGAAGAVAPELFRALGCETTELYCEVDGGFPHHHPDPSQPENLADLIRRVREEAADIGLAFDGDGDRLGVVDSRGRIIWPDRQMMLYARDVLSRMPGASILYDVKCTRHLERVIREAGGVAMMSQTGHSLIKARMKEIGAPLAGEMSGHIFFGERWYGFDDGLYAGARLLEILSKDDRPSAEVFAELPDAVATPELRLDFPREGENHAFMARFMKEPGLDDGRLITIDGLRAEFDDGWGLVRASNTTPSLILRFEADDAAALDRIQDRFRTALRAVDPDLPLPF